MLTFIHDVSVVALGFILAMAAWFYIGAILVMIFGVNNRNIHVLKNPESPDILALFVLLVTVPICHLYNTIIDRITFGS